MDFQPTHVIDNAYSAREQLLTLKDKEEAERLEIQGITAVVSGYDAAVKSPFLL